jgi:hypothetical protein
MLKANISFAVLSEVRATLFAVSKLVISLVVLELVSGQDFCEAQESRQKFIQGTCATKYAFFVIGMQKASFSKT